MTRLHSLLISLAALAALTLSVTSTLHAATKTWDGGVADNNLWQTGTNWVGDVAPIAGLDNLVFAGSNDVSTSNDFAAGSIFNGITFSVGASSFTLAGNGVTLGNAQPTPFSPLVELGGITNNSANAQTISLPLTISRGNHVISTAAGTGTLNLSGAMTVNAGAHVTFGRVGTSPGAINVAGTGLANTNGMIGGWATYATSVGQGINVTDWAKVDGSNNVVPLDSGDYTQINVTGVGTPTVSSAAASNVRVTTTAVAAQNVTLAAAGVTDINSLLFNGNSQNQIVDIGAGNTLRLGPNGGIMNSSPSVAQATGGTLRTLTIGAVAATGTLTAGNGAIDTAGTLNIVGAPTNSGTGNNLTINANIQNNGTGVVTVNTLGYIALAGTSNTFTGGLNIVQGRVQAINTALGSGDIKVSSGAQLFFNNTGIFAGNVTISGFGSTETGGIGAIRGGNVNRGISGNLTLEGNSGVGQAMTLSGVISGTGALVIGGGTANGGGEVRVGKANNTMNTYTGDTIINNTGLLGGAAAAPTTAASTISFGTGFNQVMPHGNGFGNVIMNSAILSATFDLRGTSQTINGLSSINGAGASTVTSTVAGALVLTVGDGDASGNFGGIIQNGTGTSVGLTKIGTGTQVLGGLNTYTGATTISAGRLNVNGSLAPGSAVSVASGATLGGSGTVNGTVAVAAGGALAGGSTLALANTVNFAGASTLPLMANLVNTQPALSSTLNNGMTLSGGAGSVTINVGGVLANGTTYKLVGYTGALQGAGFAGFALGTLTNRATGTLSDSGTSIDVNITSSDAPKWTGAQTSEWSTGPIAGSKNWILLSNSSATDYINGDDVLFDDTATTTTPDLSSADVTPVRVTFSNGTKAYTVSGSKSIISTGDLIKGGGATTIINNNTSFGGVLSVNAGTLSLRGTNAVTGVTTVASGATLEIGGGGATGSLTTTGITDNGTVKLNRGNQVFFATAISGSGAVEHNGTGTTQLAVANTFGGGLTINAGTVRASVAGSLGGGDVRINPGGTLVTALLHPNTFTLAGGTFAITANQTYASNFTALAGTSSTILLADPQNLPTNYPIDAASDFVIGNGALGVLNGSGNITVLSNGQDSGADGGNGLRLRGTSAAGFSGILTIGNNVKGEVQTSVNGPFSPAGTGTIRLTAGDAVLGTSLLAATTTGGYSEFNFRANQAAGNTVFGNNVEVVGTGLALINPIGTAPAGTTITLGNLKVGAGQELGVYLGAAPDHPIIFTTATLTGGNPKLSPKVNGFGAAANTSSDLVLGDINETAASSLTMAGLRTLYLTGTGGYSGTTTISSGTIQVGTASGFADGTIGPAGPTGTLGAGAVIDNAKLIFNRSNAYTANNNISGTGTIEKAGAGVLILGGTNTYQGTTTVTAGTLLVNGTHTGGAAYSVAAGATLGGTGSIGSAVTVTGTLAPGASAGTLTISGNALALNAASTLAMELVGNNTTSGGGVNDLVAVTGASGNLTLGGTLNVTEIGSGNFNAITTPGSTWTLITYGGTLTNNGLAVGSMPGLGSGSLSFAIDTSIAGKVLLTVVNAVPEANAFLAIGLVAAGTGVAGFARRRRSARVAGALKS